MQPRAQLPRRAPAAFGGALGMCFVGGSVAVSSLIGLRSLCTCQALRYTVACLLLVVFARLTRRRVVRPHGRQWLWLLAVTGAGLVLFNFGLVLGARHAEPAVLGVAVACVPILFAVFGPVLAGTRPSRLVLVAALVVTAGAVLVEGYGRTDAVGLLWAVLVFACEAAFTLCAVPLFATLGPFGVSVHTTWLAAVIFAVLAVFRTEPLTMLTGPQLSAVVYLAVAVTAVAFVLWYGCVQRIGADRAGLLTGIAPVAAATIGVVVTARVPGIGVWSGVFVVAAGLVIGLGASDQTVRFAHRRRQFAVLGGGACRRRRVCWSALLAPAHVGQDVSQQHGDATAEEGR